MSRKNAVLNMRHVLIKRRDALRKALAGDLSLLKELRAQASGDVVDAALDSVQDEISSQLAEVESRELARIEYALDRMRDGQFGACEGCGTNIPMARLNALPYAVYCIECQREMERTGELSGGGDDWSRLTDGGAADQDVSLNDLELDVTDGVAVIKLNGKVIEKAWQIGTAADRGLGLQTEGGAFDFRYIRLKEKK